MSIPNNDTDDAEDAEYVVTNQEDYISRRTLEMLYDLLEQATLEMHQLRHDRAGVGETEEGLRDLRTTMVSMLSILRPAMQDSAVWTDRKLGTMVIETTVDSGRDLRLPHHLQDTSNEFEDPETTTEEIAFVGLSDLYHAREGIEYETTVEQPGLSTKKAETVTREPPYQVLERAWDAIQDWLADNDLGLPIGQGRPTNEIDWDDMK
jgi:hypothetical protein